VTVAVVEALLSPGALSFNQAGGVADAVIVTDPVVVARATISNVVDRPGCKSPSATPLSMPPTVKEEGQP